jgi:RNA polymerase sigma factor (sigma-70 family)
MSIPQNVRTFDPAMVDVIRAVLAGNTDRFAEIIAQYQSAVLTLLVVILRDRQAALEVTQDVFVRAWRRLNSFDQTRPIKPWLMGIACHAAANYRQTRAKEVRHERQLTNCPKLMPPQENPLEVLINDERSGMLWKMINLLAPGEQVAVFLFYREDLSVEQVAHALEVSPGTVKTSLFRARQHLRKMIQEHEI